MDIGYSSKNFLFETANSPSAPGPTEILNININPVLLWKVSRSHFKPCHDFFAMKTFTDFHQGVVSE